MDENTITGSLITLADWATLLEDPTTTISMDEWEKTEQAWAYSFEIDTPEGRRLDSVGTYFA